MFEASTISRLIKVVLNNSIKYFLASIVSYSDKYKISALLNFLRDALMEFSTEIAPKLSFSYTLVRQKFNKSSLLFNTSWGEIPISTVLTNHFKARGLYSFEEISTRVACGSFSNISLFLSERFLLLIWHIHSQKVRLMFLIILIPCPNSRSNNNVTFSSNFSNKSFEPLHSG